MDSALWAAKTGLDAQQKNIQTISNNLANANTVGFKKDRAEFEALEYQKVIQPGMPTSDTTVNNSGLMFGTGVKIANTQKIFIQGSQLQTDNPLDLFINGQGFIQVRMPDTGETTYTRAGQLQLNQDGQLVTSQGYLVEPEIDIPNNATKISIATDGTVNVVLNNQPASPQQVGRIQLADFINPAGLEPIGGNLFRQTVASGQPQVGNPGEDQMGTLTQGALEGSNVNVVEELVDMIEAQRIYEMNSKAISAVNQMLRYVTDQI